MTINTDIHLTEENGEPVKCAVCGSDHDHAIDHTGEAFCNGCGAYFNVTVEDRPMTDQEFIDSAVGAFSFITGAFAHSTLLITRVGYSLIPASLVQVEGYNWDATTQQNTVAYLTAKVTIQSQIVI